jgi:lysophospholipase L1-like esterase
MVSPARHATLSRLALALTLALVAPGLPAPATAAERPACPRGEGTGAMALPAAQQALREGRPLTIVAFGSSSTEGSGASDPAQAYPARLEARLRAAMPGAAIRVLNRGRGGEEVGQMLTRLDAEVLAERPEIVIWQAGANAVLQGMLPDVFQAAMARGLARMQAAGADIVLMDNQRSPRILANPNHPIFEQSMAALAVDRQVPLFSRAARMRRWEEEGVPPAAFLVADGLHHNDRGYDCLAAALARSLVAALHQPSVMAGR